jgi:hypothetical protein
MNDSTRMVIWWPQAENRSVSSGLLQLPAREAVTTTDWRRHTSSVLQECAADQISTSPRISSPLCICDLLWVHNARGTCRRNSFNRKLQASVATCCTDIGFCPACYSSDRHRKPRRQIKTFMQNNVTVQAATQQRGDEWTEMSLVT